MLDQYQAAQEADQQFLEEMDSLYTPMWRESGLPTKASRLKVDPNRLRPMQLLNSRALVEKFDSQREKDLGKCWGRVPLLS